MTMSRCLCGSVTWEIEGPFRWMSHCHCSRCRKTHGSAFGTYVSGTAESYRLHGAEHVVKWESMPGFYRCFCGRCGSVVPEGRPFGDRMFVPAGNMLGDADIRAEMHIFVASKAPWFEITDRLPRFDAYPPGMDVPVVPDREPFDPPGQPRGSCLCGKVTFIVDGPPMRHVMCHCSRCRLAKSAPFATNLLTRASGVRFTRGADLVAEYKLPDAKHFTSAFCRECGSIMPRIDRSRDLAIVAMGSLDDDPGYPATSHIFVASKPPWDVITDSLPQYSEYAPPS